MDRAVVKKLPSLLGFLLSGLILLICGCLAMVSVFQVAVASALCLPCQQLEAQVTDHEIKTHRNKGIVTQEAELKVSYLYQGGQRFASVTAAAVPPDGKIRLRVSGWFPERPLVAGDSVWGNLCLQIVLGSVWVGCSWLGWRLMTTAQRSLEGP